MTITVVFAISHDVFMNQLTSRLGRMLVKTIPEKHLQNIW